MPVAQKDSLVGSAVKSPRLCTYVIKYDQGFSPNPFGRYCTLAACTPNRQRIKMVAGDWIMAHASKSQGHGLIYAMKVSEVLNFEQYFADARFEYKKPRFDKTWQEKRGDNIYHKVDGNWQQIPSKYHRDPIDKKKDIRGNRVYISESFYYFGDQAQPLLYEFEALKQTRQGCRTNHDPALVDTFIAWLTSNHSPGRSGNPRDAVIEPTQDDSTSAC